MNKTTPTSLLEVGDTYIQASWSHPEANTEIIAIFRYKGGGQWVMGQPLRGPWPVCKDGLVFNDYNLSKEAFCDVSAHAMELFAKLQENGVHSTKQAWAKEGGIVYDM